MSAMRKREILCLLLLFQATISAFAQSTATVNWTNVHQVIDGFGGVDRDDLSSSEQSFMFGTGPGQLGISIYHTNVKGGDDGADCTSVGTGCVTVSSNMQAVVANGGRVWVDGTLPPPQYLIQNFIQPNCGSQAGTRLIPGDFGAYATWMANYVKSLQRQGVNIYGLSVQNEPDTCFFTYFSSQDMDTFISQNLGPTFASQGISTPIFMPETGNYNDTISFGSTCANDPNCMNHVGGIAYHDYQLNINGSSVTSAPYPFGNQGNKKYWETEFGMTGCHGPNSWDPQYCETGWNTDMTTDGLQWAAILDQRMAVDNLNAWMIYLLKTFDGVDDGLMDGSGSIAKRAYVMGQYSKFVRPGYYRIDATHNPASGVSVSAYQNTPNNTLVIIATNYTGSAVSQTLNITNAPTFTTLTPTITSANQNLAQLSNVSVSGNSFTYTLPAQSITTFVGSTASIPPPTNLSGTVVQ